MLEMGPMASESMSTEHLINVIKCNGEKVWDHGFY